MTEPSRITAVDRLNDALRGRYSLEHEIGRGGMASVYLAEDLRHRRKVAVKVFDPEVSASVGPERFLREIEIVARLNHPHILPLHDSGAAAGLLFYVMPYVRGQSLREALRTTGPRSVEDAVRIARQVASALSYAHGLGLIHRDIKPENILLHEGEALLMDFGIARAMHGAGADVATGTGLIVGTPAYMSPEQAVGQPGLDARSDVYALACVLYEMLTGRLPFTGPTALALINQRLTDTAPSVRQFRAEVPPSVEQALRKALARDPDQRFPSAIAFAEALVAAAAAAVPTVAVLPFQNVSADPDNEYFADGMTEDVIAQLSKVAGLKVISRTSVMTFKKRDLGTREIAARVNASALLDGSVRRAGNRVRIVAQLIDAATDQHLWADTYDRELTDIFAIQTDVALHIAEALEAELTSDQRTRIRREPTRDLDAYQLYLRGRHCHVRFTEEGMRQAIVYFERAAARDPTYALAHAGMALARTNLVVSGFADVPLEDYARAEAAARTALALDNSLAEAHCVLAEIKTARDFDWAGGEAGFRRALELSPNYADTYNFFARMCAGLDRYDEAIALARRAQELDPIAHRTDIATILIRAGRFDEAIDAATNAIELDPAYERGHATLGWALILSGRTAEGVAEIERAVALAPDNAGWAAQLGQAYARIGRTAEARAILARLQALARTRSISPYHLAYVQAGLGDHDVALDLLEQAYEQRSGAIHGIKGAFLFAPLRGHPRFTALLKRMHLA